ncbi:uncharacterized protein LOC110906489 [Helianthus annuus]|uniref:uncharacterized protein LOC110906489 n=1 Tax=Helianthus annuus TaxID=4232 RepID=UPI000B901C8D|nr:uncharacterized protein LOC110906489 [Helianthus annuus]
MRAMEKQLGTKSDGISYFMERIWVPLYGSLQDLLMVEAHKSRYSIHPVSEKKVYAESLTLERCGPFWETGKLNPRYVGPFEIVQRINTMAHRLNLPEDLSSVHNVFHVSNLKKCLSNERLVFPFKELKIGDQLCFIEELVEILDREVKTLKHRRIPIMRVRWNSKRGKEFTWEREDQMMRKYPQLFKTAMPNGE